MRHQLFSLNYFQFIPTKYDCDLSNHFLHLNSIHALIYHKFFLVDTNLIELDTDDNATTVYAENDDDLIFEVNY